MPGEAGRASVSSVGRISERREGDGDMVMLVPAYFESDFDERVEGLDAFSLEIRLDMVGEPVYTVAVIGALFKEILHASVLVRRFLVAQNSMCCPGSFSRV